jgi:hypothetical protein
VFARGAPSFPWQSGRSPRSTQPTPQPRSGHRQFRSSHACRTLARRPLASHGLMLVSDQAASPGERWCGAGLMPVLGQHRASHPRQPAIQHREVHRPTVTTDWADRSTPMPARFALVSVRYSESHCSNTAIRGAGLHTPASHRPEPIFTATGPKRGRKAKTRSQPTLPSTASGVCDHLGGEGVVGVDDPQDHSVAKAAARRGLQNPRKHSLTLTPLWPLARALRTTSPRTGWTATATADGAAAVAHSAGPTRSMTVAALSGTRISWS